MNTYSYTNESDEDIEVLCSYSYGGFNIPGALVTMVYERYPELSGHDLSRSDSRLVECYKLAPRSSPARKDLFLAEVPAYYDYEITELDEGQESLTAYFPWRVVMTDLLDHYRTGSTERPEFKHPLTKKVISGEIDINYV